MPLCFSSSPVRVSTLAIVVAAFCSGGCVQRRMTVRTNVPGAQVYVDNTEIGRTPVSTDFIYYGKRNIRLVKDGYETQTVEQPVNAPWYQYPLIDFFTENVWPFEIRDERNFEYQLQPQYVVPTETLLSRAEELRRNNAASAALPAPAIAGGSTPAPAAVPAPNMLAPPGFLTQPPGTAPATATPYTVPPTGTTPQPSLPGYPSQPSPFSSGTR